MAKRKPKFITVKVGDTITVPADSTIKVERVGKDCRSARLAIHPAETAETLTNVEDQSCR